MTDENEKKSKLEKYLGILKSIVEIVAICIAGWWAYTRYIKDESPSYLTRADLKGDLVWYEDSNDVCQGDYRVEFHNIGKTTIEITQARISVWYFFVPQTILQNDPITYIEPMRMPPTQQVVSYPTERFNGVYGPDVKASNDFSLIVRSYAVEPSRY
jgi:hypothetical protein